MPRSSPPRPHQHSYSPTVSVLPCFGELGPEIFSRAAEDGSQGDSWQYSGERTSHFPRALGERRYDAKMKVGWLTFDLNSTGMRDRAAVGRELSGELAELICYCLSTSTEAYSPPSQAHGRLAEFLTGQLGSR